MLGHNAAKEWAQERVVRGFAAHLARRGVDMDHIHMAGHYRGVLRTPGGDLGVEVASAFCNDEQARDMYALLRGAPGKSSQYLREGGLAVSGWAYPAVAT